MAAADPNWMMLDRFVFRRDDAESFLDEEAAPFTIEGDISPDDMFSIAFRIAKPPVTSRMYLKWKCGPKAGPGCIPVAAHRDVLLLRFTPEPGKLGFVEHFFICRSPYDPLDSSPFALERIPFCTTIWHDEDGTEIAMRRLFEVETVGVLSRDEDFAIAQLVLRRPLVKADKMEADLCVLRSKSNIDHTWEIEEGLPILYEADEICDLKAWSTHRVIPFNEYLCWVNYGIGGVLFCEVFEERPKISYLRLPIHNRRLRQRRVLDRKCSVCLTKGYFGAHELTFVDVDREDGYLVGPLSPKTGFTIAYHVLRKTGCSGMKWDLVFFLTSAELWDLNKSLPREVLTFPHVSMDEPNVVHFLLSQPVSHQLVKVSVVSIDMIRRKVLSVVPYIEENDIQGKDSQMVLRASSYLQSFLPSEFPKFVDPACKHVLDSPTAAAASRTTASSQVNIKTEEIIDDCPALNTRSRKKRVI